MIRAYLSTGAGIAGVQPKIMVPDRATVPMPSLIVKAAGPSYPGLAANEYLCLSAARKAGIATPEFALSNDGQLLVLDRFDLIHRNDGSIERLGFEDIAALAGLRVRTPCPIANIRAAIKPSPSCSNNSNCHARTFTASSSRSPFR